MFCWCQILLWKYLTFAFVLYKSCLLSRNQAKYHHQFLRTTLIQNIFFHLLWYSQLTLNTLLQCKYYSRYLLTHCMSGFLRLIFCLRNIQSSGLAISCLKNITLLITFLTDNSVKNIRNFISCVDVFIAIHLVDKNLLWSVLPAKNIIPNFWCLEWNWTFILLLVAVCLFTLLVPVSLSISPILTLHPSKILHRNGAQEMVAELPENSRVSYGYIES